MIVGGSVVHDVSQAIQEEPVQKRAGEIHRKAQRANAVPAEVQKSHPENISALKAPTKTV